MSLHFSAGYFLAGLYYALPFFVYLLGDALARGGPGAVVARVAALGTVVLGTFAILWAPFITSVESATGVLSRLFPVARGLFEDKVANLWCVIDVLVKLRRLFTIPKLVLLSLGVTLIGCAPSLIGLFRQQSSTRFIYALINCSLAFFLFSFQVHEKTILLPALPVALTIGDNPLAAIWFQIVAAFSMSPLLLRDGQFTGYLGCTALYTAVALWVYPSAAHERWGGLPASWACVLSVAGMMAIHVAEATISPPPGLPDIFSLAVCGYSFAHFVGFYAYFHVRGFATVSRTLPDRKKQQ